MNDLPRIAYFSPLPPARTGIADYSRELIPHLAQHARLTLFVESPEQVDASLRKSWPVQPLSAYPAQRWEYDIALYQMGNSMYHDAMYPVLLRYPGIVVLHDYILHHFIAHRTAGQNHFPAYVREMGYALGAEGVRWARAIRQGQRPWPLFELPLNDRLLDVSLGVLVHSSSVRDEIARRRPTLPVAAVPAPITPYPAPAARRAVPGWPPDAVIFASIGQVTVIKRVDQALRALARVRESVPQARYLIAGEWLQAEIDMPAMVREMGLEEVVHCTGFVADWDEFVAWIATADVVVNLRNPTVGETSATALRALAAGKPLIVFDHGWYASLPDEVCFKIPPGDEQVLSEAMLQLATDASRRSEMGQQAARYAAQMHAPARTAEAYIDFIRAILDASRRSLTGG